MDILTRIVARKKEEIEEARRREYQAVVDSIRFTREELGVGMESRA